MSAMFLCCFINAKQASACSYEIDQAKKSAELKKVAIASLGVSKIFQSKVSNFSYFESKPTPMCPEELTYVATVTASYKYGLNVCDVELSVKKVEPWGNKTDLDTYTVTGRNNTKCTK